MQKSKCCVNSIKMKVHLVVVLFLVITLFTGKISSEDVVDSDISGVLKEYTYDNLQEFLDYPGDKIVLITSAISQESKLVVEYLRLIQNELLSLKVDVQIAQIKITEFSKKLDFKKSFSPLRAPSVFWVGKSEDYKEKLQQKSWILKHPDEVAFKNDLALYLKEVAASENFTKALKRVPIEYTPIEEENINLEQEIIV